MVKVAAAWVTVRVLDPTLIVPVRGTPVRLAEKLYGICVPEPDVATFSHVAVLVASHVAPVGFACTLTLADPAVAVTVTVEGDRTKDAVPCVKTAFAFPTVTVADREAPVVFAK